MKTKENAASEDVEIGDRLRTARLASDMTLEDVGAAVGVTYQQIRKYELGLNRISASRLIQVARVLKKAPADFLPSSDPNFVNGDALRVAERLDALSDDMRGPMLRSFSAALDALENHGFTKRAAP